MFRKGQYGHIIVKMKISSGASATTRLRREKQVNEGKQYGQILPTPESSMKNVKTSGISAATRLRRREHVQEGKRYG